MAFPSSHPSLNISLELEGSSDVDLPTLREELERACRRSQRWQHLPVVIVPCIDNLYKAGPHHLSLSPDATINDYPGGHKCEVATPARSVDDVKNLLTIILPVLSPHMLCDSSTSLQVNIGPHLNLAQPPEVPPFPYTPEQVINIAKTLLWSQHPLDEVHHPDRLGRGPTDQFKPNAHSAYFNGNPALARSFRVLDACIAQDDPLKTVNNAIRIMQSVEDSDGIQFSKRFTYNLAKLRKLWLWELRQHHGTFQLQAVEDWIDVAVALYQFGFEKPFGMVDQLKKYELAPWIVMGQILRIYPQLQRMKQRRDAVDGGHLNHLVNALQI
jgi:hypothetical protein